MERGGKPIGRRQLLGDTARVSLAIGCAGLTGCPLSIPDAARPVLDSSGSSDSAIPDLASLNQRIRQTLDHEQRTRGLSTSINGAWQIFHGILAYGRQFEIDTPSGPVNAIDYFAEGGTCAGFRPRIGHAFSGGERYGLLVDIEPSTKSGQGHRDQWLAVIAQAGVRETDQWIAGDRSFAVADWLRQAEFDVPLNYEEEFSWTLIPLSLYRPTDHRWVARDGETYSTELLLESEVMRDLQSSVCGGTHRLIGIAYAVRKRKTEGGSMTEPWNMAETYLADKIELARVNQNPDGSYSTSYMHRTGWCHDLGEMLGTTGHVLEFLAVAADDETLRSQWVRRTATKLCDILQLCRGTNLECGVLYHALHGLVEYNRRIDS